MPITPPPTSNPKELRRLLHNLHGLVLLHQELGITDYPASPGLLNLLKPAPGPVTAQSTTRKPAPACGPRQTSARQQPPAASPELETLENCRLQVQNCNRCSLQHPGQSVVFGQGNPQATLLLIGPAPGPEEARTGLPFQGEAGALLDKMLAAIGLNRELIYLTTLVKCVPANLPDPATPEISGKSGEIPAPDPQQVRACLPILQQQIAALKPKLICTMDPLPAQVLLRSQRSLLQLRGRFHDYQGIPLIATLAPEYLRQNPEMKKAAWEDLQLIRKRLARS